jgi:hypothetical protein
MSGLISINGIMKLDHSREYKINGDRVKAVCFGIFSLKNSRLNS